MLPDDGFIEVLRIKAYAEGPIRLLGVCQGGHPFHWLGNRSNNLLVNHFLQDLFNGFSTFNGDLSSGMLNCRD